MDLDRCPKCGNVWSGGDKCRSCGFVPVGVGLDKLPKKRKKRVRKYVEPGSSRGFLLTVLAGLVGWGLYRVQPWQDDWEVVRALFGKGRHHDIVGTWEIEKTVAVVREKAPISGHGIKKGSLNFSRKGLINFTLLRDEDKTAASGHYRVVGTLVAMNGITNSEEGAGALPQTIDMDLAWTGPDAVVASCNGAEAVFLRRHRQGSPLAKLLRIGPKHGKAQAPGAMRGVLGTIQKRIDENLNEGND